jgi:DNA-binding transcriptional MerR regulator/methylmalonyl-CoA mutase cobalamin-binding subunit
MLKNKDKVFGKDSSFFLPGESLQTENNKPIYSIKDIENITGIKAHTIRIWEQRYNFLELKRTATNIRYFDDADLRLLLNVSLLNNHGYKISKIAEMSEKEIIETCDKLSKSDTGNQDITKMIDAMLAFDEKEFHKLISNAILIKGLEKTMTSLVFPFLEKCGIMWITGRIQPAHEHFISNLIRQKLHVCIENLNGSTVTNSKKFLLFVPIGENHDIGLLFAHYILRSRGQQVIYLGSSLPYEDLAQILSVHKPDYIFSIVTALSSKINIQLFVDTLSKDWPKTTILLSGSQILNKKDLITPKNVVLVKSPDHFNSILEKI